MSTPNGQHPLEPPEANGVSTPVTSTVLALDGWGPVIAAPDPADVNGGDPALVMEEPPVLEASAARADWRAALRSNWKREVVRPSIDAQLLRVLAPAATMTLAIIATLKLSETYRRTSLLRLAPSPSSPPSSPSAPSRIETLRRRAALAIDPSLTPVEPEPPLWERWLRGSLNRWTI